MPKVGEEGNGGTEKGRKERSVERDMIRNGEKGTYVSCDVAAHTRE